MEVKKNIKKFLLIYLIVWLVIIAAFWLGFRMEPMLFSIVAFYVALPLSAFLVSIFLGRLDTHLKWLFIPFSGLMQFLAPFITFSLANFITSNNIVVPDIYSSFFSIVPAIIGMILGIKKLKKKKDAKKPETKTQES